MKKFRDYFQNASIYRKLILCFVITAIIPLLLITAGMSATLIKRYVSSITELSELTQAQVVANLEQTVDEYNRVTKSILVDDIMLDYFETKKNTLNDHLLYNQYLKRIALKLETMEPDANSIIMISENGLVYRSQNAYGVLSVEQIQSAWWFQDAMENNQALTFSPIHDCSYYSDCNEYAVSIIRKIYNYSSKLIGVLVIDIDPLRLVSSGESLNSIQRLYTVNISVTNQNEEYLYNSDLALDKVTYEEIINHNKAANAAVSFRKNDFLIAENDVSACSLNVRFVIPGRQILQTIWLMGTICAVGSLCCILIAFYIASKLAGYLTIPIKTLQAQMIRAEHGEYNLVSYTPGGDEVSSLIRSYNHMIGKINELINKIYRETILRKDAQFCALQKQISPHMLFNTLEAIRIKAILRDDEIVANMIKTLSDMFRMTLEHREGMSTIEDELTYVENYIILQNLRSKDRYALTLDIQDEIRTHTIISLIFQPIIENSIKYGYRGRKTKLHMRIAGYVTKDREFIELSITDDGKGMEPDKAKDLNDRFAGIFADADQFHSPYETTVPDTIETIEIDNGHGIGLANIAERLYIYYGSKAYFRIAENEPEGARVIIRIPFQTHG